MGEKPSEIKIKKEEKISEGIKDKSVQTVSIESKESKPT